MKHGIIQKNYCATEGDVRIDINELTSKKLIDKIFNVSKPRKSLKILFAQYTFMVVEQLIVT